jgi:hypothetical protein
MDCALSGLPLALPTVENIDYHSKLLSLAKMPSVGKTELILELGGRSGRSFRLKPGSRAIAEQDECMAKHVTRAHRRTSPVRFP